MAGKRKRRGSGQTGPKRYKPRNGGDCEIRGLPDTEESPGGFLRVEKRGTEITLDVLQIILDAHPHIQCLGGDGSHTPLPGDDTEEEAQEGEEAE